MKSIDHRSYKITKQIDRTVFTPPRWTAIPIHSESTTCSEWFTKKSTMYWEKHDHKHPPFLPGGLFHTLRCLFFMNESDREYVIELAFFAEMGIFNYRISRSRPNSWYSDRFRFRCNFRMVRVIGFFFLRKSFQNECKKNVTDVKELRIKLFSLLIIRLQMVIIIL